MRKIRFTIGGLMAVVLVLAIGFAALRNANETWSGVMTLATYGALGVAILGIVFRKGAQRAWWLGFFVFGWGFLCVAPHLSSWSTRRPPTLALLEWLRTKSGGQPGPPNSFAPEAFLFSNIAHCLWALLAAILGGMLARAFFLSSGVGSEDPKITPDRADRQIVKRWLAPVSIGLAGLFLIRSVMAIGWTSDAGLWAGATYLLTWSLLGLAALGAILGRGRRREIWIGATLFGIGYMYVSRTPMHAPYDGQVLLPYAADQFLNALRPLLPPVSRGLATANEAP